MGYNDLEIDTLLYRDMYICTEFLNCTHEDFVKKPRIEKEKLRAFLDVKMMKKNKESEENIEEYKRNKLLKNAPEVV